LIVLYVSKTARYCRASADGAPGATFLESSWFAPAARAGENAFVLAATRRLMRAADTPPLGSIRSLAYFLPVIDEVPGLCVNPDYFQYLRHKLERLGAKIS
jgi:hypothetical protein